MDINLKAGSFIKLDGGIFRILVFENDTVIIVQMDTEKINVITMSSFYFSMLLKNGKIESAEWEEDPIPVEKLTKEEIDEANSRAEAMERMLAALYPNWDLLSSKCAKPEVRELEEMIKRKKTVAHKLIGRYLRSGRDPLSMIDMRKGAANRQNDYHWGDPLRGPSHSNILNDDETKRIMEEGFNEYMLAVKNNRRANLSRIYRDLVRKYYLKYEQTDDGIFVKEPDKKDIFSMGRFYRFCKERGGMEISKLNKLGKERGSDNRLLHGNSAAGCLGPGHILEVDEVEIDMYTVSTKNDRQLIGKAIMYTAVDVYSRCIVACWVDYENNSYVGITNLLMCLLEDPAEKFKKYGIEVEEGVCPSGFLPGEIRSDHGAEYTSSDVERIVRETGINLTLVPPGTGSLKGLVEQSFHQFQTMLGSVSGGGFVLKRYGSRHYETACTDIEDVRKIAYLYVAYHNRHLVRGFEKTREMMEDKLEAIPYKIWQYGIKYVHVPRKMTGDLRDRFIFAILKTDKNFRISKKGIMYRTNGLYYELAEDWFFRKMLETEDRVEKLNDVRYDPRSIDQIYMMSDGELKVIPLNQVRSNLRSFKGMTWKEYDDLYKSDMERRKVLEMNDLILTAKTENTMTEVFSDAKAMQSSGKNAKRSMKSSLKEEKSEISPAGSVASRLGLGTKQGNQTRPEIPDEEKAKAKPLPDKTVSTVDEEYINALFEEA